MKYIIEINEILDDRLRATEERFLDKDLAFKRFYLLESNMETRFKKIINIKIIGPDFYLMKENKNFIKNYEFKKENLLYWRELYDKF